MALNFFNNNKFMTYSQAAVCFGIFTQVEQFCMLDVMSEWLKWISKMATKIQLPIDVQQLYMDIFEYHW